MAILFLLLGTTVSRGIAQVKGFEGRWLIINAKQDAFEHKVLRLRRFRTSDKYKTLSICLNFKKETGYVLEEKFWKVEIPGERGASSRTFGYSGQVLTWVWQAKDNFRVFCGNAFREYKITWITDNMILLKEIHSKSPSFQRPFKHNLSSR